MTCSWTRYTCRSIGTCLALATFFVSGCASCHPVRGIPIEHVDPCLLYPDRPRSNEQTIDLSLLGQPKPSTHVVDSGDVLGVYIEGVLGSEDQGPPVVSPSLGASPGALTTATMAAASLGYPVPVRDDGTISLPYKAPITVRGLTMAEVDLKVRELYTGPDGLLKPGRDRIFITLHKPRTVRVLVVRKDRPLEPAYLQPPDYRRADDGRGTAVLVELPAFENDVLHALVASGGLPGPDAENAVYVMRAGGGASNFMSTPTESWNVTPGHSMLPSSPTPAPMPQGWMSDARPLNPFQLSGNAGEIRLVSGEVVNNQVVAGQSPATPAGASSHPHYARTIRSGMGHNPWQARTAIPQRKQQTPPPATPEAAQPESAVEMAQHSTPAEANASMIAQSAGQVAPAAIPQPPLPQAAIAQTGQPSVAQTGFHHHHHTPMSATPICNTCPTASSLYADASVRGSTVQRIPLTVLPGETPMFGRSDVLLHDGDVVFIESRSQEYFYTAGLLGGGKYPLPANEDTDLLDAIALADSQRRVLPTRQIGGVSSLSQDVTVGASRVVIFRRDPSGHVIPIRIDLNRLKRNPTNAPIILPDDRIVLEYTHLQAIGAAFERHFLEGTVIGVSSAVAFGN